MLQIARLSGVFRGMSENNENEKDAEATIKAVWEKLGVRPSAETRPSGRKVADVSFEEFKQYADERQWELREAIGYRRNCGVFAFTHSVYGSWIERGVEHQKPVTLEDIKAVDRTLHARLTNAAERTGGLPNWLYLPADNTAPPITREELKEKLAEHPEHPNLWKKPYVRPKWIIELEKKHALRNEP